MTRRSITLGLLVFFSVFCLTSAFASGKALTPAELNTLFSEKTYSVEVENVKRKKKDKVQTHFKVYSSSNGIVRTLYPDGASVVGSWNVSSKGLHCVRRNLGSKRTSSFCGKITSQGNGVYHKLNKKGDKHSLTLTDFVEGNEL